MATESVDKTRIRPRKVSTGSVDSQRIVTGRTKGPSPPASTTTDKVLKTDPENTEIRPQGSTNSSFSVWPDNTNNLGIPEPYVPELNDLSGTTISRVSASTGNPPIAGSLIRNRFRLVDKIGQGGMGVVFVARDLRKEEAGDEDSLVAVKLLTADFRRHPQAFRLLQQECKHSQGLAHPNIATVYDFDRDGSTVYMTMQYLKGHTLEQQINSQRKRGSTLEAAMPVIKAISIGLAYAHEHGIVHSDLKPSNVMVTDSNEIKIFDFGIARAIKAMGSVDKNHNGYEFDYGIIGLSPRFASPEMFENASPDPRDDIFAFGCIVYQLLSGRHPFRVAANEVSVEQQVPERIPGLDERQWDTLRRSLAFERESRLESAEDFLQGFLPPVKQRWRTVALLLGITVIVISAYISQRTPPSEIPDIFDHPPPEEVVTPEIDSRISKMLDLAEVHLIVGRAISPPDSNALDQYLKVLELQKYNREAIEGLRQLLEILGGEAESAFASGDLERARTIVDIGLSIYAKDSILKRLDKALSE